MIANNLKNIRQRIANVCQKSGRKAEEITLIAVSKTVTADLIREAVRSDILDLGENYVQDLRAKKEALNDIPIRWHFIGHLQSNKVKYIADWIYLIHAVDSIELASEISKHARRLCRNINILVEVNTSDEKSKFGLSIKDTPDFVRRVADVKNLSVSGLMTMGPFSSDPENSREGFRKLRQIKESLESESYRLPILSMGMTNDFEVAIEEGATMLRIGTAIFGERK
ncbi:MAG: YggS family pyridoxal phosphate-dependent enzyme [Chlorobiaceae bacterium]|nr:YggS family pyridoxal phosphate-dependent enzyme [Chlorobiaceae bacterium]